MQIVSDLHTQLKYRDCNLGATFIYSGHIIRNHILYIPKAKYFLNAESRWKKDEHAGKACPRYLGFVPNTVALPR